MLDYQITSQNGTPKIISQIKVSKNLKLSDFELNWSDNELEQSKSDLNVSKFELEMSESDRNQSHDELSLPGSEIYQKTVI